ncbi:hypothetical protein BC939DRAFT_12435 [Gamsiella multidivaricata]|uniref:uncharacterized protein n=1 Tax=Gamsiella multidivaricata TaxID=101098 RepID=UPI00221EFF09|nr:uncharacterized protein BC939DRAFT_12435 [Gamsiella multidivaricata]KAI7829601.1 hypothetical protein BC939DRAFT_12435 [Gamsiella multidivaricata]
MPHSYTKVSVNNQDEAHHHLGSSSSATTHTSHNSASVDDTTALTSTWTEVNDTDGGDPSLTLTLQEQQRRQQHRISDIPSNDTDSSRSKQWSLGRIRDGLLSFSSPFTSSTTASSSSYTLVRGGEVAPTSSSVAASSAPSASSSSTSARRLARPATSDGVFANIPAKPEVEAQKDDEQRPPTYDSAVQDVTPPYFEMTMVSSGGNGDDILVEGIPVGNFFQFLWNVAVAVSFQFLGVLLTYLLHNSHASKAGSMVGLGITLLNFGIRMRGGFDNMLGSEDVMGSNTGPAGEITQIDKHPFVDDTGYVISDGGDSGYSYGSSADSAQMDWLDADMESHWVSLVLMVAGWMIIVKALAEYVTVKRTERLINARPMEEREASRSSIEYDV